MNAAENGDSEADRLRSVINDLEAQRARLREEVARMKQQRDHAIVTANRLQAENADLKRQLDELRGPGI